MTRGTVHFGSRTGLSFSTKTPTVTLVMCRSHDPLHLDNINRTRRRLKCLYEKVLSHGIQKKTTECWNKMNKCNFVTMRKVNTNDALPK